MLAVYFELVVPRVNAALGPLLAAPSASLDVIEYTVHLLLVTRRGEVSRPIVNEQVHLQPCVEVLRVSLVVLGCLALFGNEEFLLEVYFQDGQPVDTNTNVYHPQHQHYHSHWSLQQVEG